MTLSLLAALVLVPAADGPPSAMVVKTGGTVSLTRGTDNNDPNRPDSKAGFSAGTGQKQTDRAAKPKKSG